MYKVVIFILTLGFIKLYVHYFQKDTNILFSFIKAN